MPERLARRRPRRRSTTRSAPAPATTGTALLDRAQRRSGRSPAGRSSSRRWTGRRPGSGWPAGPPTCARSRRGRRCAGWARRYLRDPRLRMLLDRYATYTGSDPRRAPAALAVGARTSSRRSAPGTCAAGCAGSALARARAGAASAAPMVRTGADVAEVAGRGRPGRRACAWPTARWSPADVVVANADAAAPLRRPAAAPARRRGARGGSPRATPSLSGFVLLLGAARPDPGPGAPHRALPATTTTPSSTRSSAGARRPRSTDPTVYVSAPDDPALRPDDDHEAWFVLVNAPRHGPGAGASTGTRRAGRPVRRPGARRDGRARAGRARPGAVAERAHARRPRARTPARPAASIYGTSTNGARAAFLRPANRSPVPGPVPRRRLRAPRRRAAAGGPVGGDRRRPGRAGLARPPAAVVDRGATPRDHRHGTVTCDRRSASAGAAAPPR